MRDAILNFARQFSYEPVIENAQRVGAYERYIVAGMGGSHLAADLLKIAAPTIDLRVHQNYGLPHVPERERAGTLVIASSYSGNTEETLDAYDTARQGGCALAAISIGGKLLEKAEHDGVPYVRMPDTGIQPRSALGFGVKGLLSMMRMEDELAAAGRLSVTLHPEHYESEGKKLAGWLAGHAPIIYSSERNQAIAYNWKIKFNETGKIPAFYNVLPELNHNEMAGFDIVDATRDLSRNFYFIFLRDSADHSRILKRTEVLERLYRDRGLAVEVFELGGADAWEKIFSSLLLADWAAYYIAENYGLESERVPMVEEFKKLITME